VKAWLGVVSRAHVRGHLPLAPADFAVIAAAMSVNVAAGHLAGPQ
jgi:hypothetical protein